MALEQVYFGQIGYNDEHKVIFYWEKKNNHTCKQYVHLESRNLRRQYASRRDATFKIIQ